MSRRNYWAGLMILMLIIGLARVGLGSADTGNGTIVFGMSEYHQHQRICVINVTGSDFRCLTDDGSDTYSFDPVWSPDGRYIAFNSTRTGYGEIYVMEENGSNERQLTDFKNPRSYPIPKWINSHQIYFANEEEGYRQTVYRIDVDGANECVLLHSDALDGSIQSDCSQVAGQITLSLYHANSLDIYLIDLDRSSVRKLTDAQARTLYGAPQLSPDGQHIAFLGIDLDESGDYQNAEYNVKLYVMNADGSNLRYLVDTHLVKPTFGWSPDGTKIAFSATLNETPADIYVADIRQADFQRLTSDSSIDVFGDWSPDGDHIVFSRSSDPFGNWQLFTVDANGENLQYLTDCGKKDCSPDWK
jgi:Tol biopolymer transport system component